MTQTGYKATDKDGKCRGYQYSLPTKNVDGTWTPGDWHEHDGELNLCNSGFHWCEAPSGPWCYYSDPSTRIWIIEADVTAELPRTPGSDYKLVSKRIRFMSEVSTDGDYNTGNYNTGYYNTGNYNTGYRNTGDYNTGNRNAGDYNTGNYNTGDYNTGNYNTGNYNTGNYNTGNCNTGDYNTGYRNTGDCNTGYRNTGDYNATDRCAGLFCILPQPVVSFDVQTNLLYDDYIRKYPEANRLGAALQGDTPIPFEPYAKLPGITPEKLATLHAKHIAGRAKL